LIRILAKSFAFLALLGWAVTAATAADGVIDAPTAYDRQQAGALTVIDIRRPEEWRATGIPADAEAITLHDPDGHQAFLEKVVASVDGDKAAPIALICASGARSTWAGNFLARSGFTNVFNIKEGMLGRGAAPGWIARDFPLESVSP
jgi:rhodanese-related sulfurtransferase